MIPAREVGGDLYDFFRLDERRLFFLVGDVAGKGLSASIFMAVSKALYKSTMLRAPGADIGELMSAANAEVSRDNPEMLFVTVFAGILDLDTGELAYCNAGHENPYLVHAGRRSRSPHRGRRRTAAVRDRRFRLSRRASADAARRAALRRHRRRDRGAGPPPGELYGSERTRSHAARHRPRPRGRARGRRRPARRRAKPSSPAPSPRTTSRCWCCAGTVRRGRADSRADSATDLAAQDLDAPRRQRTTISTRRLRGSATPSAVGTSSSRLPRPMADDACRRAGRARRASRARSRRAAARAHR